MKKKPRFHLKSKHILVLMTLLCVSMIAAAFSMGLSTKGLKDTAGYVIIPFEKSINAIGGWFIGVRKDFQERKALEEENEALREKVNTLTTENNSLVQQQGELERLKELYDLDQEYGQYPKIMAKIISKDPGNWYHTFVIDKGSADGIQKDANVLAGKGLVGIVTEVSEHWSTVRAIIDDSSNVSAMTTSTSDSCVVQGDLQLIDEGKLRFEQLYDEEDKIQIGERLVTSNISEKFLEGIFIGYISEIAYDDNNLTKAGTIVSPVDFQHLREVLVTTVIKQDTGNNDNPEGTAIGGGDPSVSDEDEDSPQEEASPEGEDQEGTSGEEQPTEEGDGNEE